MYEPSPIQQQGVTPDRVALGPLIDIIAGARPNFMKIAPILHAIRARQAAGSTLRFRLVHTGQHYDERMSGGFFAQLGIPQPDVNLEVGSGTQAEQTAGIMVGYEKLLLQQRSDVCLVVGDVTSTMACAIAAQKLGVPVAHVEGGIRSRGLSPFSCSQQLPIFALQMLGDDRVALRIEGDCADRRPVACAA